SAPAPPAARAGRCAATGSRPARRAAPRPRAPAASALSAASRATAAGRVVRITVARVVREGDVVGHRGGSADLIPGGDDDGPGAVSRGRHDAVDPVRPHERLTEQRAPADL